MLRLATGRDIEAMLRIYAPYVTDTVITFEYIVPSMEEFTERFERIGAVYPWLVWEEEDRVLGYAYASRAFARAAYSWDADMSVYVAQDARGRGIGERLYRCLEALLASMGIHVCYALITASNEGSRRFHERLGYSQEGCLKDAGWKAGAWHDLVWYSKRLQAPEDPGRMPEPFQADGSVLRLMQRYF